MISRGIAAFLGGFTLLNLLGDLLAPGFDANIWWIDFSPVSPVVGNVALFIGGVALLGHAIYPLRNFPGRLLIFLPVALLAIIAADNAARFYLVLSRHQISTPVAVPFSAVIFTSLIFIEWNVLLPGKPNGKHPAFVMVGTIALCLLLFPLAQIYFFGHTDYRRPADVIVVFGARAKADGSASSVLSDRVTTACQLYHDGLADKLIFSGGPGDGEIDEPHAMRRLAMKLGVPDRAIYLDDRGLNTDATVANTIILFRQIRAKRVLAVSHFYHLPRIKMAYKQSGWDVFTVPATQHSTLPGSGRFLIGRELAALWAYYLHPLRR